MYVPPFLFFFWTMRATAYCVLRMRMRYDAITKLCYSLGDKLMKMIIGLFAFVWISSLISDLDFCFYVSTSRLDEN